MLASAISIEGRHIFDGSVGDEGGWKDLLDEFDVYAYWRPTETSRHTFFSRVSGTGGWSVTGPFQLTLGGSSGVRGYSVDGLPGGRRLIASLEDRIYLGSPGDGLVDLGYKKHYRVHHGANEFAKGKRHINGIESFWSFAKSRLLKFNGIPKSTFYLHLKECEFRFNHRNENIYMFLLKMFRENPLN